MWRARNSALLGLLLAFSAGAQTCEVLEYAEVKDWPQETVEKAWCTDLATALYKRILENRFSKKALPTCKPQR